VLALAGCSSGPVDGPSGAPIGVPQAQLDALDAAVAAVDTARAALLSAPDPVGATATALDDADAAAVSGQRPAVEAARAPVDPAAVEAALAAVPTAAAAQRDALAQLGAAAGPGLSEGQRAALQQVVAAGEAEAAATVAFGEQAQRAWPAYARLDEVQRTWLGQVRAGRFRDAQEAAGAYLVLRRPVQGELAEARRLLAEADGARRQAQERTQQALGLADGALAPLR
jgi:hypothetical protein